MRSFGANARQILYSLAFAAVLASVAAGQGYVVDEATATELVWSSYQLSEFRAENPDAHLVLMVTGTPEEENGRWVVQALTDQATHYSSVGIFFVDAGTGAVTVLEPITGVETEIGGD